MLVSPLAAKPAPSAQAAWAPAVLDMRLSMAPFPGLTVDGTLKLDTRPVSESPAQTASHMKVFQDGQLVQDETKVVPFTDAERTAAAGVRDALAGTSFLTDAKPFADAELPADTMRVAFDDQQGARLMLDLPALAPAPGYEPFYAAIETYSQAAGLTTGA